MISRIASLSFLALAAALFTSCGSSDIAVIPKSRIDGMSFAKTEQFSLPGPSSSAVAAATGKPRDKHSMPVYSFSERNRIVRTTAYTAVNPTT